MIDGFGGLILVCVTCGEFVGFLVFVICYLGVCLGLCLCGMFAFVVGFWV